MWSIKKSVLLNACSAAINFIPDEFMCFLGGNKKTKTIDEIIFMPTENSEHSASVNELNIPFDDTILGSLHSHPFSSNKPSKEDKRFFRKYSVNAILGYPYSIETIGFYNEKGEEIKITLLEG